MCLLDKSGFFFTTAFIPALFKLLQTVWAEIELLVMVWSVLAMSTAVSAFPEVIEWTAWQMLVGENFLGWPPVDVWRVGRYLEWSLEIVLMLIPVIEAMYGVEWPSSSWEIICCCWSGVVEHMMDYWYWKELGMLEWIGQSQQCPRSMAWDMWPRPPQSVSTPNSLLSIFHI